MDYILAALFVVFLIFEYLHTRQFLGNIRELTKVISDLKAFSMGKPKENEPNIPMKDVPTHPDFGLGEVMDKVDRIEKGEEEGIE